MSDTTVSPALKLWVVLSRAHTAIEAHIKADVARHELTPGEFGAMEALFHKGPMLLGEVKEKILTSSGGITYLIDRLEAKGFVERRSCPDDRRASYAELTSEGKALMERIFPEHARMLERVLAGLGEEEQTEAAGLLRALGHHATQLASPVREG